MYFITITTKRKPNQDSAHEMNYWGGELARGAEYEAEHSAELQALLRREAKPCSPLTQGKLLSFGKLW